MQLSIVLLLACAVVATYAHSIDLEREIDGHWARYKVKCKVVSIKCK